MNDYYYIHSRNGRLENTDTSAAEIDGMLNQFFKSNTKKLAIHFHGGLVSKSAGLETAKRLHEYYKHDAFPIFYVWESGFLEAIRNNLTELADEPVFKQLVRKLLQYTIERLPGQLMGRAINPGSVDPREVADEVNEFWNHPSRDTIPFKGFRSDKNGTHTRNAINFINEDEIQADLEMDEDFRRALATLPDLEPATRSAFGSTGVLEHRSGFSEALVDQLSEQPGNRGVISWFKVAALMARILVAVLERFSSGRDHELYATVVEEIARGIKVGGSGLNEWGQALQWNRMKKDARDAFGADANIFAGTALIERIKKSLEVGNTIDRITLIGHSTGAIYIAEWLKAVDAANLPPEVKFDIVYLAPAITYERFATCVRANGNRIRSFRCFAMKDEWEQKDQVWGDDTILTDGQDLRRYIYPSSLLYLVSGILESDADDQGKTTDSPDKPLLGMERYYINKKVYNADAFPDVQLVRDWCEKQSNSLIWSVSQDQLPGLNSASTDHGAFDNDPQTLASIGEILKG